jgi:hypothetical protein
LLVSAYNKGLPNLKKGENGWGKGENNIFIWGNPWGNFASCQ